MRNQDGFRRVQVKVSPSAEEWFKDWAKKCGVPVSGLMMLALNEFIERRTNDRGVQGVSPAVRCDDVL